MSDWTDGVVIPANGKVYHRRRDDHFYRTACGRNIRGDWSEYILSQRIRVNYLPCLRCFPAPR